MKKRLKSSSAYYTIDTVDKYTVIKLISYNTKVVHIIVAKEDTHDAISTILLWRYPSTTTQRHIRLFATFLRQNGYPITGRKLSLLQDYARDSKCNYGSYNCTCLSVRNYTYEQLKYHGFEFNKPY